MSYDIGIYHTIVRDRVEGGEEMDEFEHPALDVSAVSRVVDALGKYGYRREPSTADCRAFVKDVSGTPVQVYMFSTEIAFSVPYGKSFKEAVFEALQDASELIDSKHMCMFNPQTGEWADD